MTKKFNMDKNCIEYRNDDHNSWEINYHRNAWEKLKTHTLIEKNNARELVEILAKGEKSLDKEVAKKLIENWNSLVLIDNIDRFERLDWEILIKLLEDWCMRAIDNTFLSHFCVNQKITIENLIKKHFWWCVAGFMNHFEIMDHRRIANKFDEYWELPYVAQYLENFEWLDHKKIADKLIEEGYWLYVATYLEKFKWLDHNEIADKLLETEWRSFVPANLEKFKWLDYKKIADKLIEMGRWSCVATYLEKFEWLNRKEIAEKLIERWEKWIVDKYQEKFWI